MAALAWHQAQREAEADKCPGCGGSLAETTHPDNEGMYDGQVMRCHRCKAQHSVVERMKDDPNRASLLVYAVKEPE
jgi:uncharacterized protein with PIN domain